MMTESSPEHSTNKEPATNSPPPKAHVHGPQCQHDHHDHGDEHVTSPIVRDRPKIGRNEPCFCGSGTKYKKCHGQ